MKKIVTIAALLAATAAHAGGFFVGGAAAALDGYQQGRLQAAGVQPPQPAPPVTMKAYLQSSRAALSITGTPITVCIYNAGGTFIERSFNGNCPTSIEVR